MSWIDEFKQKKFDEGLQKAIDQTLDAKGLSQAPIEKKDIKPDEKKEEKK